VAFLGKTNLNGILNDHGFLPASLKKKERGLLALHQKTPLLVLRFLLAMSWG